MKGVDFHFLYGKSFSWHNLFNIFWIFDFLHKHFLQNVTFWVIFKRLVWLLWLYKQKVKCSISDDGLGNEDVYFLMLLDLDEKVKHKVFFSDKLKKKGHLSFCSTSCVMSCWLWFFAYFAHLWHCKIFFKDTTKSRLLEED